MEKYDIVVTVIALVGFIGSIIGLSEKVLKPLKESIVDVTKKLEENTEKLGQFNADIAVIKTNIEDMNGRFEHHRLSSHETFTKINEKLEEHDDEIKTHDDQIKDHNRRIENLEMYNKMKRP